MRQKSQCIAITAIESSKTHSFVTQTVYFSFPMDSLQNVFHFNWKIINNSKKIKLLTKYIDCESSLCEQKFTEVCVLGSMNTVFLAFQQVPKLGKGHRKRQQVEHQIDRKTKVASPVP